MNYEVKPQDGHYLVIVTNSNGLRVRVVSKSKECSCGREGCVHVRAVRDYLLTGGERARETSSAQKESGPLSLSECPVCGNSVAYGRFPWSSTDVWRCDEDSSHYWLWRGERGGAREFLCGGGAKRWRETLRLESSWNTSPSME